MFKAAHIPKKLMRYLGIGDDALCMEQIPGLWEKAVSLCQPAEFMQEMDIEAFHKKFSPYSTNSSAVKRVLKGCDRVALLVTSIGPDLEQASRDHRDQHQLFEGYILDRMGSFMVESLMRDLDSRIADGYCQAKRSTTIRYSPGYQDFPLECQKIFVQLAATKIPCLKIDSDFQLQPEKTVTAIKGLFAAAALD